MDMGVVESGTQPQNSDDERHALWAEQRDEAWHLARLRSWELTLPPAAQDQHDAIRAAFGVLHPDDRETVRQDLLRAARQQQRVDIEFRTLDAGRATFWHAVGRCRPPMSRLAGVCQDISARREAELAVQQSDKWTSLGQLTGGIAHDFNNLLTVISTNLEMLLDLLPAGHDYVEFIEPARKAAASGADLIARLLAFAQRQPLRPEAIELCSFLADLRGLAARTIGTRYTIDISCPAEVAACRADRVQLEAALLNLIVNARDAMPAGGRIAITAANVDAGAPAGAAFDFGGQVSIAVGDDGGGIAPEIIDRVFDPFFTTKPVGKGTGLGLSMVQGFARQSGGRVAISSRFGHGTEVALYLPCAAEQAGAAAGASLFGGGWRPPPWRVLVVDDTPDVLSAVVRMCRLLGLHPTPAASAEEAIALLRGSGFDLLLTDVVLLGRLGGAEIAREAQFLQPDIRVLYMSGYADTDIVNRAKLDDGAGLLVKPYGRTQLLAALRRIAGGRLAAARTL